MSDSHVYAAVSASVSTDGGGGASPPAINGHHNPSQRPSPAYAGPISSPPAGVERDDDTDHAVVKPSLTNGDSVADDADAASEAETLITSPVKRKEAEKHAEKHAEQQAGAIKSEKSEESVIAHLSGEDEDAIGSPESVRRVEHSADADIGDEEDMNVDSNDESESDALSDVSSTQQSSQPSSQHSRAQSERTEPALNVSHQTNALKRKHRASSAGLPNKRRSMEPPKRHLRGLHLEEGVQSRSADRSLSPKRRDHRRTVSTQTVVMDRERSGDASVRKRRAATQFPVRESKSSKTAVWEESDASSETTSHDNNSHQKRPSRQLGRSTSTPGRPTGRDHKRHLNKYGFTRLAEACENGDLDLVKEWRTKDPEQLELAEFAGNKPLQVAALNGHSEVVQYLIGEGCQIDCANVDKDTPLIDAAENGHLEVVKTLLQAGVDPLRQNLKGQQALDVITDETDDATDIRVTLRDAIDHWNSSGARQKREEEEYAASRPGPTKGLHFMARTYENLLKLVANNDRNGVREFLDARVMVDNLVIAVAAKTGDLYLVNMLLAEMTTKKAHSKAERPMLAVLGTSHFEMVKSLTELDQFDPLWRSRKGKTWPEQAEEKQGPNWRQEKELLQRLYDDSSKGAGRGSSSPVTKRENGKQRRSPQIRQQINEESDEEEAPERRRRRLMSKRDMRVASGRLQSDSSSDESTSDTAPTNELQEEPVDVSMKPPDSPMPKRKPGRPRTKSLSVSMQSPEATAKLRRRTSSLSCDKPLPTMRETAMDVSEPTTEDAAARRQAEEKSRAAAAKQFLEEAQRLEAKRREEAEAEAEVKRLEEENRKAQEARAAEEARVKEEKARAAEEIRAREEAEAAEVKRLHREALCDSLPSALAYVLDPRSDFRYEGDTAMANVLHRFTPLQVARREDIESTKDAAALSDEFWLLSYQGAALLGADGLDIFLHPTDPGYSSANARLAGWETRPVQAEHLRAMLPGLQTQLMTNDAMDHDDEQSFQEELEGAAKHYISTKRAQRQLIGTLRWVQLKDVLENLHPLFNGAIEVRSDCHLGRAEVSHAPLKDTGFVSRLGAFSKRISLPAQWTNGAVGRLGGTSVTITRQK